MNRMDYVDKVKPGDTVRIVPIDKVPNADREFKVNDLLEEGFLYGLSTTSDGYVMPYSWIKKLKVIKPGKDVSSCRRFTKYPRKIIASESADTYSCDACGKPIDYDDVNWFTSSIGFCDRCDTRLHNNVPKTILDFCYDSDCQGNGVADFIIDMASK